MKLFFITKRLKTDYLNNLLGVHKDTSTTPKVIIATFWIPTSVGMDRTQ